MSLTNYSLERKTNIVVIGTGKAGTYHLDALSHIQNANVIGLMNSGRKDPKELRAKYNVERWVKNINDLKSIENLDAIIIAVTTQKTLEIVKEVSKLNISCLIEKPLGISPAESSLIKDLLKKQNSFFYVGFNRRFYSSFLVAQEYMYKLGNPYSIHVDSPEPHSSLLIRGKQIDDVKNRLLLNTTHALDFFTFLFGKTKSIENFSHNSFRNGYKTDFMSFLKFGNNKTGSFLSHWASPGPWLLKIYGEDYQIILNLTKNTGELFSNEFGHVQFKTSKEDKICKPGVLKQNFYFLKSIINDKKEHSNLCEIKEAHHNNYLAHSLYNLN